MPDFEGINSPFDGYTGSKHGRGESSAKVTGPINKDLPPGTATPSRAEEIELYVTRQGFDRAKVEEN